MTDHARHLFTQALCLGAFVMGFTNPQLSVAKQGSPTQRRLAFESSKEYIRESIQFFNEASDLFNTQSFEDYEQYLKEELDGMNDASIVFQHFRTTDRLPMAYISGNNSVKFFYDHKSGKIEDAGLVIDFSKFHEGLLYVDEEEFVFNQTLSIGEWFKLFDKKDIKQSFIFELISTSYAKSNSKKKKGIAAVFARILSGKKQNPISQTTVSKSKAKYQFSYAGSKINSAWKPIKTYSTHTQTISRNYYSPSVLPTKPKIVYQAPEQKVSLKEKDKNYSPRTETTRKVAEAENNEMNEDELIDVDPRDVSDLGMRIAEEAKKRLGYIKTSSKIPKKLRCAEQASEILINAGVLTQMYPAVTSVVDILKARGWKYSSTPVPGAVAYSRDKYDETKPEPGKDTVRPHIGIVGPDLAVYHNSGPHGGKVIKSRPTDNDYNGRWLKYSVKYLIPPDSKTSKLLLDLLLKGEIYANLQAHPNSRS